LARATHNTVVVRVMEVIDNLLKDEHARWFRSAERSKNSLEGNRRILEAVRRREQGAAQKAMEQHIQEITRGF
jgi:DNA-binding FadR family transcriptional regulator